jgi:hypothetical protein
MHPNRVGDLLQRGHNARHTSSILLVTIRVIRSRMTLCAIRCAIRWAIQRTIRWVGGLVGVGHGEGEGRRRDKGFCLGCCCREIQRFHLVRL